MSHAEIKFIEEAKEDLRDLDGDARKLVVKAILKLETNPELRGVPLGNNASVGDLTGLRKLVVGNRTYRIVYDVRDNNTVVVIWVIGKRVDYKAYELARARIDLYTNDAIKRAALHALLNKVRPS